MGRGQGEAKGRREEERTSRVSTLRDPTAATAIPSALCECVTPFHRQFKETWQYFGFKCETLELLTGLMLKNSISSGLTDDAGRRQKGGKDVHTKAAEDNTCEQTIHDLFIAVPHRAKDTYPLQFT